MRQCSLASASALGILAGLTLDGAMLLLPLYWQQGRGEWTLARTRPGLAHRSSGRRDELPCSFCRSCRSGVCDPAGARQAGEHSRQVADAQLRGGAEEMGGSAELSRAVL